MYFRDQSWIFSIITSVSHDPSEIILIWWFAINVVNSSTAFYKKNSKSRWWMLIFILQDIKKDLKLYKLAILRKSKNSKTDSELTFFLAIKRKGFIFCNYYYLIFLPSQNKNKIR